MKNLFSFVFLACITSQLFAQKLGSTPNFKKHIQYLASEELEGRLTGSAGEKLAADYIAAEFRKAGLLPAGENGTYFQKFIFEKFRLASINGNMTMTGNPTINGLEGISTLKGYNQFYPLSVSYDTAKVISMFMRGVNYGFRTEDFNGIDTIIGAAIVKLGLPNEMNPHSKEALEADLNKRIALLVRKGAKAIILCKPQSGFSDLPEKGMKARTFRTSVPVVFADTTYSYMMSHTAINFEYVVHSIMAEGINVVAKSSKKTKSHVVIGAHYDHLGRGELGGSRKNDNEIHYGADDNASGVAMIIELAHSIKNRKFKKHNYVFVAFSGEELGLIGSNKFVEFFGEYISKTRAMLNFDMVGRIDTASPTLFLGGTGTCKTWTELLEKVDDSATLKITRNPGGTGASDHTNFYYKKIPVLSFFSGLHSEYHTSSDVDSLINYKGMETVYAYTFRILEQLNKKPFRVGTFQQVEEEKKQERAFKVTMGVMPDYGYTGKGLYISGVNPGGPAEKAGVESGDVVLKIGEHEINDIYNYMDVLKLFKKGDETNIVVLRNGEEKRLKLVF